MAAYGGHISTIQCLAPKMQSLLHSTQKLGFTMLHMAAREGHAEVVQLLINDYNLDPTARTKVCGQTCRCLARSSRASGGSALHVGSVHLPMHFHYWSLSLTVFPAARYDTCDASSRQRSHWCCRPACAQVQLFID